METGPGSMPINAQLCILLAVFFSLGLAGCSAPPPSSSPTPIPSLEPTASVEPTLTPQPPTPRPTPPVIDENTVADLVPIQRLEGHGNVVRAVSFSPDGAELVSVIGGLSTRTDTRIRLWDVETGILKKVIEGHDQLVWDVAHAPDGQFATGSDDRSVSLWSQDGFEIRRRALPGAVNSVAFSSDGTILAAGSADPGGGTIHLLRVDDLSTIQSFLAHQFSVPGLDFSPDGQFLITGAVDRAVKRWRVMDQFKVDHWDQAGQGTSVTYSPDGSLVASAMCAQSDANLKCQLGQAWIWRVVDGARLQVLEGPGNWLESVAFNADGSLIAGGDRDGRVYFWRVADGALLRILDDHSSAVNDLVFSPGGDILASASSDEKVILWGLP